MGEFYVYAYYKPGEENPFYIGKGKDDRLNEHIRRCEDLTIVTHFYNTLRKLLLTQFPIIKKIEENLTEKGALCLERVLIFHYGRIDLGTGCLTNHTNGGDGVSSRICTNETRNKIGISRLGNAHTTDARIKISLARIGKKCSKEHARKIKEGHIRTKGIPICSYNLITGGIIGKYTHINAVKGDGHDPCNVSKVINGKLPYHHGFGWRHLLASEIEKGVILGRVL